MSDKEQNILPRVEHLESVFWGDGGEYVIVTGPIGNVPPRVYGPFYNDFVARTWAGDMGLTGWVQSIRAPEKPSRRIPDVDEKV